MSDTDEYKLDREIYELALYSHKTSINDENFITRAYERFPKLLARIAELEAIVAKLPTTAGGVPIAQGMNLYRPYKDGLSQRAKGMTGHYGVFRGVVADEYVPFDQCYSTAAAARNEQEKRDDW